MRPHGRLRGRPPGGEDRWDAVRALSSRPFCPCKGQPGKPVVIIRKLQVHIWTRSRCQGAFEWTNTLRDRCSHISVYGLLPTCKRKIDDERQRATWVYTTSRGGATPWS